MTASTQTRDTAAEPGFHRAARTGYRWLLLAFLAAVTVQMFLAGLGVFSVDNGNRTGGDHAFSAHQGLGFTLAGASILLLVLAFAARPGRLALWLAVALVVQTCLLQSLLDGLADNTVVFGGLHAMDGLLMAASAGVQYPPAMTSARTAPGRPGRLAALACRTADPLRRTVVAASADQEKRG